MPTDQQHRRELRKLLVGQVPADFADWLDFVAVGSLLAFAWNVEPFVFALLAVAMGAPYLVVGPFAGILVDRSNTKTVLVLSNATRGSVTLSFVFAPNWQVLLALVALRSAVDTFFTPAKQSALQALTSTDTRTRANAISHGINQASKVIAPAIGGSLLIWAAPQALFAMNSAVSFVAVVLLLRLVDLRPSMSAESGEGLGLAAIRAALRDLKSNHILRLALLMMAAGYFAMFFYDTLIAPLTRDLGFSETQLGLALAAVGVGGVIGAGVMSMVGELKRPFLVIALGTLVSGMTVIFLGHVEIASIQIPLAMFLAAFAVLGFVTSLTLVPFRVIIQTNTTDRSIGQITALSEAANMAALMIAPFIGALVATISSIGAAFVLGGIVMTLVAARAALLWRIR